MIEQFHSPEAETALLAACLHTHTARTTARQHITGPDFHTPIHETIWDAMNALDANGRPVEWVTLLEAVRTVPCGPETLATIMGTIGIPSSVVEYATQIRDYSIRRKNRAAGIRITQDALNPNIPAVGLTSKAIQVLTDIRDQGIGTQPTHLTLRQLMAQQDETPDWVIPGLLERSDRLMLTGTEGLGKSTFSRMLGVLAAAGIHPFEETPIPPIRVAFIDCENKTNQLRRNIRPLLEWVHHHPTPHNPLDHVMVDPVGWIDIASDQTLAKIHLFLDQAQPDLVVIGPLYKLTKAGAITSDDDATPILAALETITDRGCALILEAHAGKANMPAKDGVAGDRDLRPRGSSALLGWPEFGLGMRGISEGYADIEEWRGSREKRQWPDRVKQAPGNRWVPVWA